MYVLVIIFLRFWEMEFLICMYLFMNESPSPLIMYGYTTLSCCGFDWIFIFCLYSLLFFIVDLVVVFVVYTTGVLIVFVLGIMYN